MDGAMTPKPATPADRIKALQAEAREEAAAMEADLVTRAKKLALDLDEVSKVGDALPYGRRESLKRLGAAIYDALNNHQRLTLKGPKP